MYVFVEWGNSLSRYETAFMTMTVDFDVLPNQHVNHASHPFWALSKKIQLNKLLTFGIFQFGICEQWLSII